MATARTDETDLRDDLNRLREDLASLTRDVRHFAERRGEEVVDGARAAAREARARAEAAGDRAAELINERPLTSIAGAFLVGLVLGKLFQK